MEFRKDFGPLDGPVQQILPDSRKDSPASTNEVSKKVFSNNESISPLTVKATLRTSEPPPPGVARHAVQVAHEEEARFRKAIKRRLSVSSDQTQDGLDNRLDTYLKSDLRAQELERIRKESIS